MKKILLVITSVIILAAIPIILFFLKQRQELRSRAAPSTHLSLEKVTSKSPTVGDEFTINININTNQNQALSARIVLNYDQAKLEADADSVQIGTIFPTSSIADLSITAGKIDFSVPPGTDASDIAQGEGVLATVKFKAIASGTANMYFDQNLSVVYGLPDEDNVVDVYEPLNIVISPGQAYPTLELSPTPSSSESADLTATISATATKTPTATPTQSSAGSSDSAEEQELSITSPGESQSVTTQSPTIRGKASPGSTITIVINSQTPITAVITADSSGNWSYTPTTDLTDGGHSVTVTEKTVDGDTNTATSDFYVNQEAIPETGIIENTLLILLLGVFFIVSGLVLL